MPAIHVRDLDDALIVALKERAARNHRSLQGELKSILEEAASTVTSRGRKAGSRLHLRTVRVGRPKTFSREVVYDDER